MGVPTLPDIQTLLSLGLKDPKNVKLPTEDIKIILRTNDEQIHCNRFKWYNLPRGLDGQLIERILYYRGQGAWFVLPDGSFAFLPFCHLF